MFLQADPRFIVSGVLVVMLLVFVMLCFCVFFTPTALTTISATTPSAFAAKQHHHTGNTNEDVDNPLKDRPVPENEVYHIPVTFHKLADADKPPVKSANDDKEPRNPRSTASSFISFHMYA